MNVMIDLKTLFLIVLGIALLVLIVYLIQLTRKLLTSMDHTINILEDVATITDLAAKRSKDVDGIIGDVPNPWSRCRRPSREIRIFSLRSLL